MLEIPKTDFLVTRPIFVYALYRGHTPAGYGEPTQAFVWKDVTCKGDEDYLHECEFKETNRCNGYRAPQVLCDVPFRYTQSEGKVLYIEDLT